jgi:hypothetical protein
VTITLDVTPAGNDTVPIQLMHFGAADAHGMAAMPDMHTALMRQPDGSYKLWVAGRFLDGSVDGSTGQITTSDFRTFGAGPLTDGTGKETEPDFVPTCRGAAESTACWNNFDAVYSGADLVWQGTDGDLRMLYHGACGYFGEAPPDSVSATWCEVGIARSLDGGVTWGAGAPVISGSDAKPATDPSAGIYGAVEPGALIANGYIYCYYDFFPLQGSPEIQVARSPVSADGAPGSWLKCHDSSFSEAGLLGGSGTTSNGDQVVPTIAGCTRPAQPWPVYSDYLGQWVLVYVGKEGWFFTTSSDLVYWNTPVRFFPFPGDSALDNFHTGSPTYENVTLVTPGEPDGVIGQTGIVLYAYTSAWGQNAHMMWSRPFRFDRTLTNVTTPSLMARGMLEALTPNPGRGTSAVTFRLPRPGTVDVAIFDSSGRRVKTITDEEMSAGEHMARIDERALVPGVYLCRLAEGGDVSSIRFERVP